MWILRSFLERGTKYPWEELQRQSVEQRLKEGPSRDSPATPGDPSHIPSLSQTLFWMPTSACGQTPDIAISEEAPPVPDKYRGGSSQPTIRLSTGSPVKEVETQGAEGVCSSIGGTTI